LRAAAELSPAAAARLAVVRAKPDWKKAQLRQPAALVPLAQRPSAAFPQRAWGKARAEVKTALAPVVAKRSSPLVRLQELVKVAAVDVVVKEQHTFQMLFAAVRLLDGLCGTGSRSAQHSLTSRSDAACLAGRPSVSRAAR